MTRTTVSIPGFEPVEMEMVPDGTGSWTNAEAVTLRPITRGEPMDKTFDTIIEQAFRAGYASGVHDGGNPADQIDKDYAAFRKELADGPL